MFPSSNRLSDASFPKGPLCPTEPRPRSLQAQSLRWLFPGTTYALQRGDDIGFSIVLSLEQKRLAGDLGERISKAVAEIQPLDDDLFEIVEGLARDVRLLDCERLDDDICPA